MNSSSERQPVVLVALIVALAAFAAFGRVIDFDFVNLDDDLFVYRNPHIQGGLTWTGVRWAFSADLAFDSINADYWQPITSLSRLLDTHLWGLRPGGHHLTNLLLHAANAILVFLIFLRLTGAFWWTAWVALVFALHPLQVETVAWVTARKDVLSAFFGLLSLLSYISAAKSSSRRYYALAAFWYVLSLMSKPMLLAMPVLLCLLDFWPLGRLSRASFREALKLILEKWAFIFLSILSVSVTIWGSSSGVLNAVGRMNFLTAPLVYLDYLCKAIFPRALAALYPLPARENALPIAAAAILLAGLTVFVVGRARKSPHLAVGWLWFLTILLPTVGHSVGNRFMYLPLIGLALMSRGVVQRVQKLFWARVALGSFGLALLVAYGVTSWFQLGRWQNGVTLFEHAIRTFKDHAPAYVGLGIALQDKGRVEEAILRFEKAVELSPDYMLSHYGLGNALEKVGRVEDAIGRYEAALAISPAHPLVHQSLGSALMKVGKYARAEGFLKQAVEISPDYFEALNNLGVALVLQNKLREAIPRFEEAKRLAPRDLAVRLNLARAFTKDGRPAEAVKEFEHVLELRPDLAEAQVGLAEILAEQGK